MRKKLAITLAASLIASNTSPVLNIFADEVLKKKAVSIEKQVEKIMTVDRFKIKDYQNFEKYNDKFKIKVSSIDSKGGSQPNSPLENAIDGDIQTHWESYEKNTDKFKGEVILGFDKIEKIDRIAYQVRQDGASKGKGFPIGAEIYVSTENAGDDNFKLAGKAEGTQISHDMIEFKFDTVNAKRVKFVFTEVRKEWASAAEFWLYREDELLNKMDNLFTDSSKSKLNEEFNTKEKLDKLEEEVKSHPLYDEVFKKDIDKARKLIEKRNKEAEKNTIVNRFSIKDYQNFEKYNDKFKIKVSSIDSKGGSQPNSPLENAIDGDIQTHWESYEKNTDKFKGEVILGFDKIEKIDRIAYQVRQDGASKGKGFPIGAEIYVSTENAGDDNFKLAGKAEGTQISHDMIEFKFDTVNAKRVKFVFTEVRKEWASAAEFWLYREDELLNKMDNLFTDSSKSKLNEEFNTKEKLDKLEEEVKSHPLYDEVFKKDIDKARKLIEKRNKEAEKNTIVNRFSIKDYQNFEKYNDKFKIKVSSIDSKGGSQPNSPLENAIDGDIQTHWESYEKNTDKFKGEVILGFDKIEKIDRIAYQVRQDGASKGKGFPIGAEIYVSTENAGDDNFKLAGKAEGTQISHDMIEFKFDTVNAKRVKFVFTEVRKEWASAAEFWLYREDELLNKMDNLFTDSSKSKLNEEFNTKEKLDKLEEEVKSHPLYDEVFKKDIDKARKLIEKRNKEAEKNTIVNRFSIKDYQNFEKYNDKFKIKVSSIDSKGGSQPNSPLENAIDGDIQTHWESYEKNTDKFKGEVILGFDKIEKIDRIAYQVRQDGASKGKGFPIGAEIYVSTENAGDDNFKLAGKAEGTQISHDMIEFKFDTVNAKRVKFVFTEVRKEWASAAEFWLYREDELSNKMDNLFTDSSKSKVNEEFNTKEKLDKLEEEVKSHPLYDEVFKEDINNARILISEQGKIEPTKADTSIFNKFLDKRYSELFKIPSDKIKSISNNGSHYTSMTIDKAIDNNLDTYWETRTRNDDTFKNEVIVEFTEDVDFNRLVYGARKSDRKGFANKFEIYTSKTTKGETFQLVATGKSDTVPGLVEAKFKTTKFRRVKFKFIDSTQNWASLSELAFYKEDKLDNKMGTLFTSGLMDKVSSQFNSQDKINALKNEVKDHPLYESKYKDMLDRARAIISGAQVVKGKTIELERRGNSVAESQNRKMWNFQDWQVTGLSAKPGNILDVYVDVAEGEPTPTLLYKQLLNKNGSTVEFKLKPGKNTIVIPDNTGSDPIPSGVIKGGALYMTNYYTDEEQSRAPRVRIENASTYPVFKLGESNDKEVMEELKSYVEKLEKNPDTVLNLFDVSSNKTLIQVKARDSLWFYKEYNMKPSDTANRWDDIISKAMKFWGYDGSKPIHSDFNFRINLMVKNLAGTGAVMNASNGTIGMQPYHDGVALYARPARVLMHELGHLMDTRGRIIAEVTNNILPMYFDSLEGTNTVLTDLNILKKDTYPKVILDDYSKNKLFPASEPNAFTQLVPIWQLQTYDKTFYPKFEQKFRENDYNNKTREDIYRSWVIVASEVLGLDLTEFFGRHGIHVTQEVKDQLSKYPKPNKKIWYLSDKALNYSGNGFTSDVNIDVDFNGDNKTLTFNVDNNNKEHVLGYEIYKKGKLIAFTDSNSFVDNTAGKDSSSSDYKIVAYDKKLNSTNKRTEYLSDMDWMYAQTGWGTIRRNHDLTGRLYGWSQSFDKGIGLHANGKLVYNIEGKGFTKLEALVGVDIKYAGKPAYLKFRILGDGKELLTTKPIGYYDDLRKIEVDVTGVKILTIEVLDHDGMDYDHALIANPRLTGDIVSKKKVDFLSDVNWKSATTGWGNIRVNNDLYTKTEKVYKGIGFHANGRLVYDLRNKGYKKFVTQLGVDPIKGNPDRSSIRFRVYGDGELLADTGTMNYQMGLASLTVNVEGVNELTIELLDTGDGNAYDHGILVYPELIGY